MKTKKITFISQLYPPDLTTTAIVMGDLAESLSNNGFKVNILCAYPTYFRHDYTSKCEICNGVAIKRIRTFLLDKNKIIGRSLNSVSFFLKALVEIICNKNETMFVYNTNPALLPTLGLFGRLIRGQQYVVLIHDLWPELPAYTGMFKEGGFLFKMIDFLNILSLKYSSGIIVLSEVMKKVVLQKVPEKGDRIFVIHNWADKNKVYPIAKDTNSLLKQLGLDKNKKVVMYSGNLGRYQPLEVIIYAAEYLKDHDDIVFLFTGGGGKKKMIKAMVQQKGLQNVRFMPFQPMEKLAESLSMADISLMGIMPENEGVIMPSKLYGLLAVGRPIICVADPDSEVVSILKKAGAGYGASIDDPKDLASKIVSLLDDPETMQQMGESGRKYFLEHFERKKVTAQWKEVLESIIEKERIGECKPTKQKRIHAPFQKEYQSKPGKWNSIDNTVG